MEKYKGYRYEKDSLGYEYWYDENNILRKHITYYHNGNKKFEKHYNQKGQLHNDNDFAYQRWFSDGILMFKSYYVDGKFIFPKQFNKHNSFIHKIWEYIKKFFTK